MKFKQLLITFLIISGLFTSKPTLAMEENLNLIQKCAIRTIDITLIKNPKITVNCITTLILYKIYKNLPDKYKHNVTLFVKLAIASGLVDAISNITSLKSFMIGTAIVTATTLLSEYLSYLYLKKAIDKNSHIHAWIALKICLANPNSFTLPFDNKLLNEPPLINALKLDRKKIATLIWMHHLCIKNIRWKGKSAFGWAVEKQIPEIVNYFTQSLQEIENIEGENIDRHCGICLEDNATHKTSCRHKFCYNCITSWMTNNPICPECRAPID